jgi:hypothetical protein
VFLDKYLVISPEFAEFVTWAQNNTYKLYNEYTITNPRRALQVDGPK